METNTFEILRPVLQGSILALIVLTLAIRYAQTVLVRQKTRSASGMERHDLVQNPLGADEEMVWLGLSGQVDEEPSGADELGLLSGPHERPAQAPRRLI